jgi:DNA-directed RNA polymerase specialized sigma subunit
MQVMKFTNKDKTILRKGLMSLYFWERQILIYRFWENRTIEEIAAFYETSWSDINSNIERLMGVLREFCINDPEFSLFDFVETAA